MVGPLCFENIEKVYGDRVLLSIDAVTLKPRECMLISGDNGSGKTALLKIVSGLLQPDQATVTGPRGSLPWKKALPLLRGRVVYLHQNPYMFDASVYNNVAYGLRAAKLAGAQLDERVWQSLHWARLDHLTHRNARLLSDGEKQRVALTRARIINPSFLAMDEPTAFMDRRSRHQTYELIRQLQHDGMSIIIASHEVEAFSDVIDNHYYLEAGHLHKMDIGTKAHKRRSKAVVTPFHRRNR